MNMAAVSEDLMELIRAQNWLPMHLSGVSVGCDFCIHLHALSPADVLSMTLMAFASAAPNPPDKRKDFEAFTQACRESDGRDFYIGKLREPGLLGKYFLEAPEHAKAKEKLFNIVGDMDVARASGLFQLWNTRTYTPDFSSIKCPTLLLAGKMDDWFIQNSIDAKARFEAAQLEYLDNVGHQIPLEGTLQTVSLMHDFIRRTKSQLRTARTKGGRVWSFREYPGPPGAETLIMLHSCFFNKDTLFGPIAPKLATSLGLRVVCIDLPSSGGTSAEGSPMTMAAVTADLMELIKAEGWGPLHLSGVSVGCDICIHLQALCPTQVLTMTLMAFASAAPNPPQTRKDFEGFTAACREAGGSSFYMSKLREPGLLGKYFLEAPEHQQSREALFDAVGRMDVGRAAGLFQMWNFRTYTPDFASIKCPTLILAGKMDDWFIQNSVEAKARFPAAQLEYLDNVGHQIPLEGTMETLRLMQDFFCKHLEVTTCV